MSKSDNGTRAAIVAAEADVKRLEAGLQAQRDKLAEAEAARAGLKEAWAEQCLLRDVDGAANQKALAAAETAMAAGELAIERAALAAAEFERRLTIAKDALWEATYHDADAELAKLDARDDDLEDAYIRKALELKEAAKALLALAEAKAAQVKRKSAWAGRSGAPNTKHGTPTPFAMSDAFLVDPVRDHDFLQEHLTRRLAVRHG